MWNNGKLDFFLVVLQEITGNIRDQKFILLVGAFSLHTQSLHRKDSIK